MALDIRLQDLKYRNWVRASLGLRYLKQGLTSAVVDEAASIHATSIAYVQRKCNKLNTHCNGCRLKTLLPVHVINNTPCPYRGKCDCFKRSRIPCPKGICGELYDTIVSEHTLNNPIWDNTDSLKWSRSPWELAKCFLNSSGYKDKQTADECDASGLLSICINCKTIRSKITDVSQFEQARAARNEILHSSSFELEDAKLAYHIGVMLAVLNDPIIQQQPDADAATTKLQQLLQDKTMIDNEVESQAREMALDEVNATLINIQTELTVLNMSEKTRKEELECIEKKLLKIQRDHYESTQKHKNIGLPKRIAYTVFHYDGGLQRYLVETYKKHYLKTDVSPIFPEVEHIDEMFIPIKLSRTSKYSHRIRKEIKNMSELFKCDGHRAHIMFIAAEAGMGKTTLCKKIVSTWCTAYDKSLRKLLKGNMKRHKFMAEEESWRETEKENVKFMKSFTYLFFVNLRNAQPDCSIERMVENDLLASSHPGIFRHIINNESESCLFILDGLDEWKPDVNIQSEAQRHGRCSDLPFLDTNCTILYTTRPWKLADVPLQDNEATIELEGLTTRSSEWLVYKMLAKLNEQQNMSLEDNVFLSELKASNLCHFQTIPIMVKLLVCLWFDNQEISDKITAIYCDVLKLIMKVFSNKGGQVKVDTNTTQQRSLPFLLKTSDCAMFVDVIMALCKFSHKTYMDADSLVFTAEQLKHQGMTHGEIQVCLDSGLLSKTVIRHAATYLHLQVSYIHKTFQEFFVALHIATTTGYLQGLLEKCTTRKTLAEQSVILPFVCGFDNDAVNRIAEHIYSCSTIARDDNEKELQTIVFSLIKETQHVEKNSIPLQDINIGDGNVSDEKVVTEWIDPTKLKTLNCKDIAFTTENSAYMRMTKMQKIVFQNCSFNDMIWPFHLALQCHDTLTRLTIESSSGTTLSHTQATCVMCLPMLIDITLSGVQCRPEIKCGCDTTIQTKTVGASMTKMTKKMSAKTCRVEKSSQVFNHILEAPNLETFSLDDYQIDKERTLHIIPALHGNLKSLNIKLSTGATMSHSQITDILCLPKLVYITLSGIQCRSDDKCGCDKTGQTITDETSKTRMMKTMSAKTCHVENSSQILNHIVEAPNIEAFSLQKYQIDTERLSYIMLALQRHSNLIKLNIVLSTGTAMFHSQVTDILCLPKLVDITLSGIQCIADNVCGCDEIDQPIADGKSSIESMRKMNVKTCRVDKSSQILNHILEAPNIETLIIEDKEVDQERLVSIMRTCEDIRYITLCGLELRTNCLQLSDKCRNIRLVLLADITVSGATLKYLIQNIPPHNPKVWLLLCRVLIDLKIVLQDTWNVPTDQRGVVLLQQTFINNNNDVGEVDVKTLACQIHRCPVPVRDNPNGHQIQDTIFSYIRESEQQTDESSVPLKDVNITSEDDFRMIKYIDTSVVQILVIDGVDICLSHSQVTLLLCLPVLTDIALSGVKCEPNCGCGCELKQTDGIRLNTPSTMNVTRCSLVNTRYALCHVLEAPNLEYLFLSKGVESQNCLRTVMKTCRHIHNVYIDNPAFDDLNLQLSPKIYTLHVITLERVTIRAAALMSLILSIPTDHPTVWIRLACVNVLKDQESNWLRKECGLDSGEKLYTAVIVNMKNREGDTDVRTQAELIHHYPVCVRHSPSGRVQDMIISYMRESKQQRDECKVPLKYVKIMRENDVRMIKYVDSLSLTTLVIDGVDIHLSHSQVTSLLCLPVLTDVKIIGVRCEQDNGCGCVTQGQTEVTNSGVHGLRTMNVKRCSLKYTIQALCHVHAAPELEKLHLINSDVLPNSLHRIFQTCKNIQYVHIENTVIDDTNFALFPYSRSLRTVRLLGITIHAAALRFLMQSVPADSHAVLIWMTNLDIVADDKSARLLKTWNVHSGKRITEAVVINKNKYHKPRVVTLSKGMKLKLYWAWDTSNNTVLCCCIYPGGNSGVPDLGTWEQLLSVDGETMKEGIVPRDVKSYLEKAQVSAESNGKEDFDLWCQFRPDLCRTAIRHTDDWTWH